MVIAVESLLFLLAGIILAVVLTRVFSRPTEPRPQSGSAAVLRLVRTARTPEGREETRLVLNGQNILSASNDGVRLTDYADEVEQLEAIAARLAEALGVTLEFERVSARGAPHDNGIAVRDLPPLSQDEITADERRRRLDQSHDAG